jgi:hypothetical protein
MSETILQKAHSLRLPLPITRLFTEAHRRRGMGGDIGSKKPIDTAWIGLGNPSTYKPGVEAGYFRPFSEVHPRVLGWYLFTEKGIETYKALYGDEAIIDFEAEGRVAHNGQTGGFELLACA